MNRWLLQLELRLRAFANRVMDSHGPRWPPLAWNFTTVEPQSYNEDDCTRVEPKKKYTRFEELFGVDLGILWGGAMPVTQRSASRKFQKRYGYYKLWRWKTNLISCQNCGAWHELHTICGKCYEKVKQETETIKKLYVSTGSVPTQEAIVLYNNEKLPEGEFWNGKRIIEMKKERPLWFSADLKKRWHKLLSPRENSDKQS